MKESIITLMTKAQAKELAGSCTQTSKMPCQSYSLPTEACITGAKMAEIKGSICSQCYADKGFYKMYAKTIKPAQHHRLASIESPDWVSAMVSLIGKKADYFRWHDSGDLQSLAHFDKIVTIAQLMPQVSFWLPTREYAIIKDFVTAGGVIPSNLVIRLSAMFPDVAVVIPESLKGIPQVTVSNVHSKLAPIGFACNAPAQGGECKDCRACWDTNVTTVSYHMH